MVIKQIALHCDRAHVSKCDRCALQLWRSYWMQAEPFSHQIHPLFEQMIQMFEQDAVIIVRDDGAVEWSSPQAEQLLVQYEFLSSPTNLSSPLMHWFKSQVNQEFTGNDRLFQNSPFHIKQSDRQLSMHVRAVLEPHHYLLGLEEQSLPTLSISSLELLGLTRRESEVLFWIAKDKSNAAIAKTLNCCEGTVRKHLENIYKKLSVQTRTGAVMTALEQLGLIKV